MEGRGKCLFCGKHFSFLDRLLRRIIFFPKDGTAIHLKCLRTNASWFNPRAIQKQQQIRVDIADIRTLLRCELRDLHRLHIQSVVFLGEQIRRGHVRNEAVVIEATREGPATLQEIRKVLYWLEMNAPRRSDTVYDGAVSPEIVSMLEKVSGMSAAELSREFKDRDLKRAFSRKACEDEKNGKIRKKG